MGLHSICIRLTDVDYMECFYIQKNGEGCGPIVCITSFIMLVVYEMVGSYIGVDLSLYEKFFLTERRTEVNTDG